MGVCYHLMSRLLQVATPSSGSKPGLVTLGLIKASFSFCCFKAGLTCCGSDLSSTSLYHFQTQSHGQFKKRWVANVSHPGSSQSVCQVYCETRALVLQKTDSDKSFAAAA